METKWLEDFVSLAETRSFSRSACVPRPPLLRNMPTAWGTYGTAEVCRRACGHSPQCGAAGREQRGLAVSRALQATVKLRALQATAKKCGWMSRA